MHALKLANPVLFLSTLSLRRATQRGKDGSKMDAISIHALLAESDGVGFVGLQHGKISIHALLAESDGCRLLRLPRLHRFLSTLSLRRATAMALYSSVCHRDFYPRSPCGERRLRKKRSYRHTNFYPRSPCGERLLPKNHRPSVHDFYPRSPCGERRNILLMRCLQMRFLSTLSLRRATIVPGAGNNPIRISIHALLAESDPSIHV